MDSIFPDPSIVTLLVTLSVFSCIIIQVVNQLPSKYTSGWAGALIVVRLINWFTWIFVPYFVYKLISSTIQRD